jgi:hypothetical protein
MSDRAITWMRAGTNYVITMSTTSQQTPAFAAQTRFLRVATSTQPAWVKITDAASATADTTSMLIGTNVVDYFIVTSGQKAAVLAAGTAGSITFTEMS